VIWSSRRRLKADVTTCAEARVANRFLRQQYFDYIAVMKALDVEIAAEYLVIAAILVYLKSKWLLPPIPTGFLAAARRRPRKSRSACAGGSSRTRSTRASPRSSARRATGRNRTSFGKPANRRPSSSSATASCPINSPGRFGPRSAAPSPRSAPSPASASRWRGRWTSSSGRARARVRRVLRSVPGLRPQRHHRDVLAILELIRQRRLAYDQPAPDEPLRLLPFRPVDVHAN